MRVSQPPMAAMAEERRMHTITITRRPKDATPCKYTVKLDMIAPLKEATPPGLELFVTFEEAEAYAKQLQLKLGGPDKAKIVHLDLNGP
jgi:hypothetical protein